MKYKVITADNANSLAVKVEAHLDQGWKLQGGVSVTDSHQTVFAQALVKEDKSLWAGASLDELSRNAAASVAAPPPSPKAVEKV